MVRMSRLWRFKNKEYIVLKKNNTHKYECNEFC